MLCKCHLQRAIDKNTWREYDQVMPRKLGKKEKTDMDKESVLKMSREENEGRLDEREMAVSAAASKVGMLVGGLVCIVLVFLGTLVLNAPEISFAGWMVYFSMYAGSNLALFRKLGNRRNLIWGIITAAVSACFCAALFVLKE